MVGIPGHHSPEHRFFCARTANRRRSTMNDQDLILWKKLQQKWLTRRNLIRGAAGTAAGAGLLLGSGLRLAARADHDDDEGRETCALALPLPHTTAGPFGPLHFYFPGPIDGSAAATDGTGTHA